MELPQLAGVLARGLTHIILLPLFRRTLPNLRSGSKSWKKFFSNICSARIYILLLFRYSAIILPVISHTSPNVLIYRYLLFTRP